ncbi:unnamed protein product [Soboliphyme baturini]|uniref:Uncharacterized protein n=1 Tax=Soboliphyme baturini TaxID=241478 RepID=A0A183INK9_9BILA|nr:unnamed protein product [Soboliphyme baturini]
MDSDGSRKAMQGDCRVRATASPPPPPPSSKNPMLLDDMRESGENLDRSVGSFILSKRSLTEAVAERTSIDRFSGGDRQAMSRIAVQQAHETAFPSNVYLKHFGCLALAKSEEQGQLNNSESVIEKSFEKWSLDLFFASSEIVLVEFYV